MNRYYLRNLLERLKEKTRRVFYVDSDRGGFGNDPSELFILCESLENSESPHKEITGPLLISEVCRYIEGFLAGFDLGFSAEWKCEECGDIAEWSHIDAEDGGTPTCTQCSSSPDMVLHRFGRAEAPSETDFILPPSD